MTGFFRDGYCKTGAADGGNHAVAATVTDAFLDFSAARGNDLRPAGVTHGCRWCLCASRWREAVVAADRGQLASHAVPRVSLRATNLSALGAGGLDLEQLRRYADERGADQGGRAAEVEGTREGGEP
jgi:uncharacterized protein (DUF2237 family)